MKVRDEREAEILRLHHAERWKVGTIANNVGAHPSVIRRVLGQAGELPAEPAARRSIADPYLPFLCEMLEKYPKIQASRLHAMVKDRGYPGQASRFREIIAAIRPRPKAKAYLRLRTLPGEQAQVDWGDFGKIRIGRAERRLLGFVLVLSWSRRIYLRFFIGSRMPCFLAGHARAFERIGGVPRVLLYDNLKSAVIERRGDAIRLHPTMLELAAHYRFEPRICAPARGNEKGRVERSIRYIRGSFFMAREYADLDDLNAQAEAWCEGLSMDRRWPDDHARRVREVYEEERPRLLPLPELPFPCEERVGASVGKTPYVRFDWNDYSVPHDQVQQELEVLASNERVRIVRGTRVLAEHARSYDRGLRIEDPSHLEALVEERTAARQHRATERLSTLVPSSVAFLVRCAERGQNLGSTTAQLMRLCVDYGSCPLEQALVEALAKDLVAVSSVRHLVLQHVQGHTPAPQVPLTEHPRLASLIVRPHDLGDYDRLGGDAAGGGDENDENDENDESEEVGDGEG